MLVAVTVLTCFDLVVIIVLFGLYFILCYDFAVIVCLLYCFIVVYCDFFLLVAFYVACFIAVYFIVNCWLEGAVLGGFVSVNSVDNMFVLVLEC